MLQICSNSILYSCIIPFNEEFDEGNLINSLTKNNGLNSEEVVDKLITDVKIFSNGTEQSDDITSLALKYLNKFVERKN